MHDDEPAQVAGDGGDSCPRQTAKRQLRFPIARLELIDGSAIKTPRKARKISELQISNRR